MLAKSTPSRLKNEIDGAINLTNGYRFAFFYLGYVDVFESTNNIYHYLDPTDQAQIASFVGKANMTTNEAIALARESIKKLGYKLEYFGAQSNPTQFEGPIHTKHGLLPYCKIRWELPEHEFNHFEVNVDMQTKTLVGLALGFEREFSQTNHIGTPLKVDVEPELESDYKKRMGGRMYIRTNAPPRPPKTVPTKLDE
jgi:hypothetical protein